MVAIPKAKVLPEPVGARPLTSRPASASGRAAAWMGNGSVMAPRVRTLTRSAGTPRSAKVRVMNQLSRGGRGGGPSRHFTPRARQGWRKSAGLLASALDDGVTPAGYFGRVIAPALPLEADAELGRPRQRVPAVGHQVVGRQHLPYAGGVVRDNRGSQRPAGGQKFIV